VRGGEDVNEIQGAIDSLVEQGMTRRRAALAAQWANSQRGKGTGRDYSKPGHCGADAEPVDSAVTGEVLAWLCPTCGVSWYRGDLPPGARRVIPVVRPVRDPDLPGWMWPLFAALNLLWVAWLAAACLLGGGAAGALLAGLPLAGAQALALKWETMDP
jgi:hypothetical protein